MISDKYSTARMWALTKRCFIENRRNITITAGVIFGIMLLVTIMITKAMCGDETEWSVSRAQKRGVTILIMFIWVAGFIAQILGSLTFSSMSSKQKRIPNLMLPAAQSEKFISQCLLYIVGGNLFIIISMFLVDTTSALIFGMLPGWLSFDIADISNALIGLSHETYGLQILSIIILGSLSAFLLSQSIYVLGSAWWPRKSFLKTFVALFALQMGLSICIPFGLLFNWAPTLERLFSNWDLTIETGLTIGWIAVILAYSALFIIYWLAWQRYKRLEVVKRFL